MGKSTTSSTRATFPRRFPRARSSKTFRCQTRFIPVASINSLTYLWQDVIGKKPTTISLTNNAYLRSRLAPAGKVHGFRSWYGWGPDGQLLEGGGQRYCLSMVLAVTSGRGNSVGEAIQSLRRSTQADGTHPRGTIYYMENDDVRSHLRDADFPAAAAALQKLGVAAVVEQGPIPLRRPDVQGLMAGTKDLNWGQSGNKILPGALCDYFTSFGGIMTEGATQTPLSELIALRRGRHRWDRSRALVHPAESGRSRHAGVLCLGLHAGRIVLSSGDGALSTADRRRSAVPPLGQHSAGERRALAAARHAERHRGNSPSCDLRGPQQASSRWRSLESRRPLRAVCRRQAEHVGRTGRGLRSIRAAWPMAFTSCGWWPWRPATSKPKAARSWA